LILELIKLLSFVCLLVFNGMVLFRAVANRILNAESAFSETQLFTHSLFFSFVLNGIVGQYLAMFYLFRLPVFLLIFICNLFFFRKEAAKIVKYALSIPLRFIKLVKNDSLQFLGWCLFSLSSVFLLLRVQIPSQNIDVWVHHIPIAESIVKHNGFIYPIIPHLFYGNMPSFIEVLFAEGLIFTDNHNIANLVHYSIYFSFLVLLGSFSAKGRTLALVLLSWMLIDPFLRGDAVTAMTDPARACFATMSIVFLLMSFEDNEKVNKMYYLAFSALLCGAALASKYLGLLSLFLCGLTFLVEFQRDKAFFKKVGIYLIGILVVAGFWYGKNLSIYKNPIYPYMFGHQGLSDKWMADLKEDQGKAFSPEYRQYSRDLLSISGWRDFGKATYRIFFNPSTFPVMLVVLFCAMVFVKNKINLLVPASVIYFILWYFFVFHQSRYGITAYFLFLTAFYFCTIVLIDKIGELAWNRKLHNLTKLNPIIKKAYQPIFIAILILSSVTLLKMKTSFKYFFKDHIELAKAYVEKESFEKYMSKFIPYYGVYSFIAKNNLTNVLNPLDNGAVFTMKYLIPGKKPEDVFLPWNSMCSTADELDNFVAKNNIRYFVHLNRLTPVAVERLGKEHTEMTFKVFSILIPKSELLYLDSDGNKLYKIRR
jgi:hypothetical protein